MSNKPKGTLYIGVTNNLVRRVFEHREGLIKVFTKRYNLKYLVYFETTNEVNTAIQREKNLKTWFRKWKIELIEMSNPNWRDLYTEII